MTTHTDLTELKDDDAIRNELEKRRGMAEEREKQQEKIKKLLTLTVFLSMILRGGDDWEFHILITHFNYTFQLHISITQYHTLSQLRNSKFPIKHTYMTEEKRALPCEIAMLRHPPFLIPQNDR
jgi:hypothetical protein